MYTTNYRKIVNHHNSATHSAVVSELIKKKSSELDIDYFAARSNLDKKYNIYSATSKMFLTVYAEIRSNLPFINHHYLVELQKANGLDLGHYFANRDGATRITESISLQMHYKLLENLKSHARPISIIIDLSEAGFHYLCIMLQTIENKRTVIYFYKIIKLDEDETGEGIYNAIIEQFKEDDLFDYIKQNLVGFASDGASSMISPKKALSHSLES